MRVWAHLLSPSSWSPEAFRDLGSSLLMLAAAAIGLWLASGLGRRLAREASWPLALGLGTGTLALAALATGLLGLWPVGLWLTCGALAAAGFPHAPRRFELSRNLALLPIAWSAANVLVQAWAPPAGWDATAYHLSLPRFYLEAGGIVKLPWLLHGHWPHLMETLYALPLSLGLDCGPALIHAALCFALVAAVWQESPWAAAILAAQPVFMEIAAEPHADGALALFTWLSALTLWRGGSSALAGLLAGLAFACKLQGAAPAAALLAWTAWKRGPREAATFALCAAALAVPWIARDWLWPFGPWGDAETAAWLKHVSTWSFPRDLPLLKRYEPYWLIVPLIFTRRVTPLTKFLALPAAALFLIVFRYHEAWRFLLPALPLLCLLVDRWKFLTLTVLLVSSGQQLYAVSGAHSNVLPGYSSREVYLRRRLPYYAFYKETPEAANVLLWRETRGYYLPSKWRWGDPRLQKDIRYDDAEAAHATMRKLGLTHVLINEGNALYGPNPDYYKPEELAVMDELLKRCATLEKAEGPLSLRRLLPACGPRR